MSYIPISISLKIQPVKCSEVIQGVSGANQISVGANAVVAPSLDPSMGSTHPGPQLSSSK